MNRTAKSIFVDTNTVLALVSFGLILRFGIPGGRMPPSTAGKDACRYNRLWT